MLKKKGFSNCLALSRDSDWTMSSLISHSSCIIAELEKWMIKKAAFDKMSASMGKEQKSSGRHSLNMCCKNHKFKSRFGKQIFMRQTYLSKDTIQSPGFERKGLRGSLI